jgi:hypothetical protein
MPIFILFTVVISVGAYISDSNGNPLLHFRNETKFLVHYIKHYKNKEKAIKERM